MKAKLKKDNTVNLRIPSKYKKELIKRKGSIQKWFDKMVLAELSDKTKKLDRVLWEIENKEALQSYFDYEESDDCLEKKLQQREER